MTKRVEIVPGTVFGKYTVLGYSGYNKKGALWLCLCECGTEVKVLSYDLRRGHSRKCENCNSNAYAMLAKNKQKYISTDHVSGYYFNQIVNGAIYRNKEFQISITDLEELWIRQQGRCALTGWLVLMTWNSNDKLGTASLDRIDSSIGYTVDNIQWVHKDVNQAKMAQPEKRFFEICQAVVSYKQETKKLRGSRPWIK